MLWFTTPGGMSVKMLSRKRIGMLGRSRCLNGTCRGCRSHFLPHAVRGVPTATSLLVAGTSSVGGVLRTPKVLTSGGGCVESLSNDSDNKRRMTCPKGAHSKDWSEFVEFAWFPNSQGMPE